MHGNDLPMSAATTGPAQARNVREIIQGMPLAFNSARASGLRAVLQFHVTGDDPGAYHLRIAAGRCTFHEGVADDATTVITTPSEVWLAVAQGKLDGGKAMMEGLYTVSGDFGLMMQMEGLFSGTEADTRPVGEPGGPIRIPGMAWMTVAFIPWIIHWVLTGIGLGAIWSIGLPLVLGAGLWLYRRAFIKPTWLDAGGPLFFAAAGIISLLAPGFWMLYGAVLGSLAMAGIWMGTLATDTPLTADYSCWNYPPEIARNRLFLKTNGVITVFWAAVFLLQAAITLAGIAYPAQESLWLVVRYLTLVPGFWFTGWFQKWYPAHVAAGRE
jgi:putative sterol carrier protein